MDAANEQVKPLPRWPWRKDFSVVSPAALRAARYALQMVARCPHLHRRLHDDAFLRQLWSLSFPLVCPEKLAQLKADWNRAAEPDSAEGAFDDHDGLLDPDYALDPLPDDALLLRMAGVRMREYLIARFVAIPDSLITALVAADGATPTHPSIALLGPSLGLSVAEQRVLDFVEKKEAVPAFRRLLRETDNPTLKEHLVCLAAALDVAAAEVQRVLDRRNTLRSLALIKRGRRQCDLEDLVQSGDLLDDLFTLEPATEDELLAVVVEPAARVECEVEEFPHLARDAARLRAVFAQAAKTGVAGVNALFYGPPGCGKTQFASAVAQAAGLQAFQVKSADDEGDGLSRAGRLGAYRLTQRLLGGRSDCVIVFDEVEDVFGDGERALAAALADRPSAGRDKGWINRLLEDNPLPSIWITNDVEQMDPAFLRRFLLPVAFATPPRRVRRTMAARHLDGAGVSDSLIDELAADAALMPAHFGAARRLVELQPDAHPDTVVREGLAAARRLLHGAGLPRLRRPAIDFDVAYLNLAGGIEPGRLADALSRSGRGTLCFYGPPGTGKTEFAHVLADALDRELVVKASSDLVSSYLGETERNIARLFNELDPEHSLLLLDEVDSLLRDRGQAQRSWELTQVNELLQQMERFNGIFIAATNLMTQLDGAAMRRFDFKLAFRPLSEAQRLSLFAREALGDGEAIDLIPAPLARRLASLHMLTPGDFANVVRQRTLLGEVLEAEEFLRRLVLECRHKGGLQVAA